MPIGFQNRRAPRAAPTPPWRGQGRGLGPGEALDDGAADAVLGEQDDQEPEPDDAVRPAQEHGRDGHDRQRDDQERLAPADPVGPEPDRELGQARQRRQGRDDPDRPVREPLLAEVERQIGQGEADRRHAEEVRAVESDAIPHIHGAARSPEEFRLDPEPGRGRLIGRGSSHADSTADAVKAGAEAGHDRGVPDRSPFGSGGGSNVAPGAGPFSSGPGAADRTRLAPRAFGPSGRRVAQVFWHVGHRLGGAGELAGPLVATGLDVASRGVVEVARRIEIELCVGLRAVSPAERMRS